MSRTLISDSRYFVLTLVVMSAVYLGASYLLGSGRTNADTIVFILIMGAAATACFYILTHDHISAQHKHDVTTMILLGMAVVPTAAWILLSQGASFERTQIGAAAVLALVSGCYTVRWQD